MLKNYTENEIAALAAAWRTLMRRLYKKRVSEKNAADILRQKLEAGFSVDQLLNPANYGPDYLPGQEPGDLQAARAVVQNPGWNEGENFDIIAECVHDFYVRLTGRGGQWNTQNARDNLARAIGENGLDTILSEELYLMLDGKYREKNGQEANMSFFAYIQNCIKELWRLKKESPETSVPSGAQVTQLQEDASEEREEDNHAFEDPDLVPPPGMPFMDPETEGFETQIIPEVSPRICKREAIAAAISNYSLTELECLSRFIIYENEQEEEELRDGKISVNILIEKLTDGDFLPEEENAEARKIHMSLNGDLNQQFVNCVNQLEGLQMDNATAQGYDILYISWDLRDAAVRKFYKLQQLILKGSNDPDLLDAIADLENLYLKREGNDANN